MKTIAIVLTLLVLLTSVSFAASHPQRFIIGNVKGSGDTLQGDQIASARVSTGMYIIYVNNPFKHLTYPPIATQTPGNIGYVSCQWVLSPLGKFDTILCTTMDILGNITDRDFTYYAFGDD